jgi:hypothetical protein
MTLSVPPELASADELAAHVTAAAAAARRRVADVARACDEERARRTLRGVPTDEPLFGKVGVVANDAARAVLKRGVLLEEEAERVRRVEEARRAELVGRLVRELHGAIVDRAADAERARRVAAEREREVAEEAARAGTRRAVLTAEEAERQRKMVADADFPFGRSSEARDIVLGSVVREFSRRAAVAAEEVARQERLLAGIYSRCAEQASRRANQLAADRSMDAEQKDRALRQAFEEAVARACEQARLRAALLEIDAEREAQTAEQAAVREQRRDNDRLAMVLEQVERLGNVRRAMRMEDAERARRVSEQRKDAAMEELTRVCSRREADQLVRAEVARCHHGRLLERVHGDLLSERSSAQIALLIEEERRRQAQLPRSALPSELLEAVERRGNAREADAAMDAEQERRGIEQSKGVALEQLVRQVQWRAAVAEVEMEAARAQHERRLERALDELLAESARDETRVLTETERARLLAEPPSSTPRSALPSEVLEAVERRGNAREADAAMDAEQERRCVEQSKGAALEQLVCEVQWRAAKAEVEVEAARAQHERRLERALDELLSESARDEMRALTEAERARLLGEPPSSTPRSALPSEVLEAVERRGNAREADAAMDAEQERRCVEQSKGAALEQLVREVQWRAAKAEVEVEAARAQHERRLERALDELLAESARDETRALTEAERARLLGEPPSSTPRSALPSEVLEAIERRGNAQAADAAAELERERRAVLRGKAEALGELQRTVTWRDVRKLVEAEAAEAQHRRQSGLMLEEVARRSARLAAGAAAEVGRAERVAGGAAVVEARDRCEALQVALEGVRRAGQVNQVRLLAEQERERRVLRERLDATLNALVRHVAQVGADAEAEGERVRRVSRDRGLLVLEELERHHARLAADAMVRAEREDRTRAFLDPADPEEQARRAALLRFSDVLTQVERRANALAADQAAERERERRVAQARFDTVLRQLERESAAKEADLAADCERARRLAMALLETVVLEIKRRFAGIAADLAADLEQARRVRELAESQHTLPGLDDVHEEMRRRFAAAAAHQACEGERARRAQEAAAEAVYAQLLREANARRVAKAVALERARVEHQRRQAALLEELREDALARDVTQLALNEQARRVEGSAFFALRFAAIARSYLADIPRAAKDMHSLHVVRKAPLHVESEFLVVDSESGDWTCLSPVGGSHAGATPSVQQRKQAINNERVALMRERERDLQDQLDRLRRAISKQIEASC